MTMTQCIKCKNSNPKCRESFMLYYSALSVISQLADCGNRDSKFFKDKEDKRCYSFNVKCSHYEPKEENNGD